MRVTAKKSSQKVFKRIDAVFGIVLAVVCGAYRLAYWETIVVSICAVVLLDCAIAIFRRAVLHESPDDDVERVILRIGYAVRDARRFGDEELARRIETIAARRRIKSIRMEYTAAQLRAMRRDPAVTLALLHRIPDAIEAAQDTVALDAST